jgi:anti-anti-sigma factor
MASMDLRTRENDGRVLVALRGELDIADAASAAAALVAVAARAAEIIVDLAGLEFIDASGVAALVLARVQARRAGGDLLDPGQLIAPDRPDLGGIGTARRGAFGVASVRRGSVVRVRKGVESSPCWRFPRAKEAAGGRW